MKHSLICVLPVLLLACACSGQSTSSGYEQPLRVSGAQFRSGALPGTAPLSAIDLKNGLSPSSPRVTSYSFSAGGLRAGTAGNALRGRASAEAASVALALADAGSGYWVLPVGAPDPSFAGELSWALSFDLGYGISPGLHELRMVAIDLSNRAGTQESLALCINSEIPDNANACLPTRKPPNTVFSLSWDKPADLDLQVLTPSGKLVGAKHPTTAVANDAGKLDTSLPDTGVLDRDAGLACAGGPQRENLVFTEPPAAGRYQIFARLYDPCDAASVRFQFSIWVSVPGAEEGTFEQVQTYSIAGIALAEEADQSSTRGTFLTEVVAL